jgi:urea transport system ATP-binding protein
VADNLRRGLSCRSAATPIPAELFDSFPVLKQMLLVAI